MSIVAFVCMTWMGTVADASENQDTPLSVESGPAVAAAGISSYEVLSSGGSRLELRLIGADNEEVGRFWVNQGQESAREQHASIQLGTFPLIDLALRGGPPGQVAISANGIPRVQVTFDADGTPCKESFTDNEDIRVPLNLLAKILQDSALQTFVPDSLSAGAACLLECAVCFIAPEAILSCIGCFLCIGK